MGVPAFRSQFVKKQEKTAKGGINAKQLQAAGNNDYLLKILAIAKYMGFLYSPVSPQRTWILLRL